MICPFCGSNISHMVFVNKDIETSIVIKCTECGEYTNVTLASSCPCLEIFVEFLHRENVNSINETYFQVQSDCLYGNYNQCERYVTHGCMKDDAVKLLRLSDETILKLDKEAFSCL